MARAERVLVAVDVNNLWHSCQQIYGVGFRVSYPRLENLVSSLGFNNVPRETKWVAYVVEVPHRDDSIKPAKNARFIGYLEHRGFQVKKRKMYYDKGANKPYRTDWDVGIAIDALLLKDTYDTFTLVSGDGDYAILINKLRWFGKRVEVITFEKTTSQLLYQEANNVVLLSEEHIFQEPSYLREFNGRKDSSAKKEQGTFSRRPSRT